VLADGAPVSWDRERRCIDYPNPWNYTRRLDALPGIAETVDLDHVKRGYYSIPSVNPTRWISPWKEDATRHGTNQDRRPGKAH